MSFEPTVTVGFVARERFSAARRSLERIFTNTDRPFNLVVVDCNMPEKYRRQMYEVLRGKANVQIITTPGYLLPGGSRNLILKHSRDDYVCFVENDCLVPPGWLSPLIGAAQAYDARVAAPLIMEGRPWNRWRPAVHHDPSLGSVKTFVQNGRIARTLVAQEPGVRSLASRQRQIVGALEEHCVLFERSLFDDIGLFDEALNVNDHVDLLLTLHQHQVRIVLDPAVRVQFCSPPPIEKEERDFSAFRWDVDAAYAAYAKLSRKWNVTNLPEGVHFAKGRMRFGSSYTRWWFYRAVQKLFKHDLVDHLPRPSLAGPSMPS